MLQEIPNVVSLQVLCLKYLFCKMVFCIQSVRYEMKLKGISHFSNIFAQGVWDVFTFKGFLLCRWLIYAVKKMSLFPTDI